MYGERRIMQALLETLEGWNTLIPLFLIAVLGYLIGSIKIKGIELGTAGVLLVALIFGHFGYIAPAVIQTMGLILFVCSVGFIAGPKFFRNFKQNAKSYILLGFLIILSASAACIGIILITGIPSALAVGLMTGAMTSTPGLAAAKEAAESVKEGAGVLATAGYGIAYPFGVIGVVLMVQLVPKFLKLDMDKERAGFEAANNIEVKKTTGKLFNVDAFGYFALALAIVAGILLGKITIPLPGGASFSLGTTGGPLIVGLIFGHFAHIGKVNITPPTDVLKAMREFGLMLFLLGAGTSGGSKFVAVVSEYGVSLFFYGAIMTLVPMLIGYIVAKKVLKLSIFNNLGSITGGMTSTPALGTLISVAGTDDVASSYAATYPIALVAIVLASQFITVLF